MDASFTPPDAAASEAVACISRLVRKGLPGLITSCRREILARPALSGMARQFRIAESEDWLRQAISLFQICMQSSSPASEWHDEMGELSVDVGLTIADAGECLCILRDELLRLVWAAAGQREVPHKVMPVFVDAILHGFDSAMAAQASAYVRESHRQLSQVYKQLEFRQAVFERDLGLARLVQQHFIPERFESKNFQAEVRYIPTAGVGGDHAGIFPVGDERLYVTICDVTGHGIASALVAEVVNSRLQPLLRSQGDATFQYPVEPVEIIRELNTLFFQEFQDLGMLLSFFVAMFDARERTLTYSGAGHPPPLLQPCGKGKLIQLRSQNIILGAEEDCIVDSGQDKLPLHPGNRVIFYTDGIIEAGHDDQIMDITGLQHIVEKNRRNSSSVLADRVIAEARKISGLESADDMSLIVLDVLPPVQNS